jgi:hypothetical protein
LLRKTYGYEVSSARLKNRRVVICHMIKGG